MSKDKYYKVYISLTTKTELESGKQKQQIVSIFIEIAEYPAFTFQQHA